MKKGKVLGSVPPNSSVCQVYLCRTVEMKYKRAMCSHKYSGDQETCIIFLQKSREFYCATRRIRKTRGESNTPPGFYNFCVRQFRELSLFRPHSCSLAFSFHLLASHAALGTLRIRLKIKRSENEA